MGLFSWLFRRQHAAQGPQPPQVAPQPEDPDTVPLEAAQTGGDEDETTRGLAFDPDATIVVSPKISAHAQQALRKLREYSNQHIAHYTWVCAPDCGQACKRVATEGPYSVEEGLSGLAPIPGVGAYKACRCTIAPARG
jgi:hypothetical protein